MPYKSVLLHAVFGAVALAASVIDPRFSESECGTPQPSSNFLETIKSLAGNDSFASAASAAAGAGEKYKIITYIHVIASSDSPSDGYISRQDTFDQIDKLNEGFKDMEFYFLHKGTSWTINPHWANDGDDLAMKKALRKGTHRTLNIYVQPTLNNANGYCYFPKDLKSGSDDFYLDGCNVRTATVVPQQGTTTTHEVGHWLGLLHTFEGGCDGYGDYVDDTPACTLTRGCNIGQDTCPGDSQGDDVTNFMSYNSCRIKFTEGQKKRMFDMLVRYRMF